ncbi:phosphotransferase family protein [Pararhodonellum marinum]|uniref:phosphotransferase family protein n=1 Tax=Pararhodonellum marinum TaxID=2755358 RepID=UPI001E65E143|nr:phosphotransferase family protein [Pararhodonellum marinum]
MRKGEELPVGNLLSYLRSKGIFQHEEPRFSQFPSGFSNLTYLLEGKEKDYVLRRPPFGAKIKSAHDMSREYRILKALENSGFAKIPKATLLCEDENVIGAPFFLMERIQGIILRNQVPVDQVLTPSNFRKISLASLDTLLELHQLELVKSGLMQLGKPEGYVERQVKGWAQRYDHAATDTIPEMEAAKSFLLQHIPPTQKTTFIHNDFKYDNLVLDPSDFTKVSAVLDWEMATVGDPLMDLGTSLTYWVEAEDDPTMKAFNLTWEKGNLTRQEVIDYYGEKSGLKMEDMPFYYAFGAFKVGVICQQIYYRYKQGFTQDPRFGALIAVVKACGSNANRAIQTGKI